MQQKPLTPQSCDDFRSPLDDARTEIATLKAQVAALTKAQQWKADQRVLDLQLKNRAVREFLRRHRLLAEFQRLNP